MVLLGLGFGVSCVYLWVVFVLVVVGLFCQYQVIGMLNSFIVYCQLSYYLTSCCVIVVV